MASRNFGSDDRGLSEMFAVGVLIGITLLMVLSVGVYVLAVDVDDDVANETQFSYDYDGEADTLLVRYTDGDEYAADEIVLASGRTEATWAELAGLGANGSLAPGDALQLSPSGNWGDPITDATELRIHHVANDSRTQLSNWTASP